MKKSIIVTLTVLCLTASLVSFAAAQSGHVYVGVEIWNSDEINTDKVLGGELQLTRQLTVSAASILDTSELRIGARYDVGRGHGGYVDAYIDSGSAVAWRAGGFFDRALSDRFSVRAMLGVYSSQSDEWRLNPDAAVAFKYDLSGPLAVVGEVSYPVATVAIAYEF